MWSGQVEALGTGRGLRLTLAAGDEPATVGQVMQAWQGDAKFRAQFNSLLAGMPYGAFRWETPATTLGTLGGPFECVVLDSPALDRPPDEGAFAEHWASAEDCVVTFANLGQDAILVVPTPVAEPDVYPHLAAFVRGAPEGQQQALWKQVGETLAERVSDKPVWLSTAGAGVAWLHLRLDDRPKYYGFEAYRRMPR